MAKLTPVEIACPMEGVKAYKFGRCNVLVDRRSGAWHMSISHHRQNPTWQEIRDARYALIPDEATMAMFLPPRSEYVNLHDFCFHLHEVESGDKIKPSLK